MAKLEKVTFFNKQEAYKWANECLLNYFTKNKKPITIHYGFNEDKTLPQLRYLHKIIADYLTPVLFNSGNIQARSIELAKCWLKEDMKYGKLEVFKFKGEVRNRFIYYSFRDATKEQMMPIIDRVIQVCAFADVIVPEPTKGEV
jgi:hypothetical protein